MITSFKPSCSIPVVKVLHCSELDEPAFYCVLLTYAAKGKAGVRGTGANNNYTYSHL